MKHESPALSAGYAGLLRHHAAVVARSARELQREVARRESGELRLKATQAKDRTLVRNTQTLHRRLQLLTRHFIVMQETERKQLSRELHEGVAQILLGINFELWALGTRATPEEPSLRRFVARSQRLVERSVTAVHRFARELRPALLDDLGLIPALYAHSQGFATRKKLRIQMTAFAGVETLARSARNVLFRVAQEALNNVARHAAATQVVLCISHVGGAVQMEISDNGKSFAVDVPPRGSRQRRLGLLGMRERVEMLDGSFNIESTPGRGTTVRATIPFRREKAAS